MSRMLNIFMVLFFMLSVFSLAPADETLTITTYYPSPYGSYNQLTTTGNTYLATTSGNVGIGTTGPTVMLDVAGTIYSNPTSGAGTIGIKRYTDANYHTIYGGDSGTGRGDTLILNSAGSASEILFKINAVDKVMIDSSGNVGIGTTGPGNKLHVVGGIRVTTLAAASATTVCRDGSSDLSTCSSSRKFKDAIEYLKPVEEQGILQNIRDTNIARFRMKTENSNVRHIGIIAEESPKPLQFIDEHNNQNIDLLSAQLGYTWAAIKALDRQIGGLQNENKQLKAKISLLEAKLKRK